jgi:hypothetical protein
VILVFDNRLNWAGAKYIQPLRNKVRGQKMSGRITILAMCFLNALNVILVAVNVSTRSSAAVAGMDRSDLRRDRDFRRAVEDIVESCSVGSGGSISC